MRQPEHPLKSSGSGQPEANGIDTVLAYLRRSFRPNNELTSPYHHYARSELITILPHKGVIIPSKYSELIADYFSEKFYPFLREELREEDTVLDVGTGTGFLGITMKKLGVKANVVATDINKNAVEAALQNAHVNGITKGFTANQSDMLQGISRSVRIVFSNPAQLPTPIPIKPNPNERETAYWAGKFGRYMIDELIIQSRDHLQPGGYLIFTHTSLANMNKTEALLTDQGYEHEIIYPPKVLAFRSFYDRKHFDSIGGQHERLYDVINGIPIELVSIVKARLKPKATNGRKRTL